MSKKEMLEYCETQKKIPFRITESGLYCVGGFTMMPFYFKTIKGAYNKIKNIENEKTMGNNL